jgi:hypothetical protein
MGETGNVTNEHNRAPEPENQFTVRRAEIRADLLKWVVGSVALTLITTIGNWTFQYFSMQAEAEKTNRELKIKEKDMQLQYLDKFTSMAIDQDIKKRIRLAHYISRTTDDNEYKHFAERWSAFYTELVGACKTQFKAARQAGKIDVEQELSDEPACTIGGTETLRPVGMDPEAGPSVFDLESGPGGMLGELIARGESGAAGYNTFNRGNAGDIALPAMDFSTMSIAEIMALQALPAGDAKRLFAVGKYLLLPVTMRGAVAALQLDREAKFTPAMQERLFRNYLLGAKRPSVRSYITGSSDNLPEAQFALAREFASVADPNSGRSIYDSVLGNHRATISAQETAQALNKERTSYQKLVSQGKTPDEAWNALSPGIAEKPG